MHGVEPDFSQGVIPTLADGQYDVAAPAGEDSAFAGETKKRKYSSVYDASGQSQNWNNRSVFARLNDLKRENEVLSADCNELDAENIALRIENAELSKSNENLSMANSRLMKQSGAPQCSPFGHAVTVLHSEIERLTKALEEVKRENRLLELENKMLRPAPMA